MALYAKLHGVGINTPFLRKRLTDGKQEVSEMDLKAVAKTMENFFRQIAPFLKSGCGFGERGA